MKWNQRHTKLLQTHIYKSWIKVRNILWTLILEWISVLIKLIYLLDGMRTRDLWMTFTISSFAPNTETHTICNQVSIFPSFFWCIDNFCLLQFTKKIVNCQLKIYDMTFLVSPCCTVECASKLTLPPPQESSNRILFRFHSISIVLLSPIHSI